jgi:hypothetical protein
MISSNLPCFFGDAELGYGVWYLCCYVGTNAELLVGSTVNRIWFFSSSSRPWIMIQV